jgi:hypothetical protein
MLLFLLLFIFVNIQDSNLSGASIAPISQFHVSPMWILLLPEIEKYQVGVVLSIIKFTAAHVIESSQI